METLAKKIKKNTKTAYQQIAEKYGTDADYVGKIARGKQSYKNYYHTLRPL